MSWPDVVKTFSLGESFVLFDTLKQICSLINLHWQPTNVVHLSFRPAYPLFWISVWREPSSGMTINTKRETLYSYGNRFYSNKSIIKLTSAFLVLYTFHISKPCSILDVFFFFNYTCTLLLQIPTLLKACLYVLAIIYYSKIRVEDLQPWYTGKPDSFSLPCEATFNWQPVSVKGNFRAVAVSSCWLNLYYIVGESEDPWDEWHLKT